MYDRIFFRSAQNVTDVSFFCSVRILQILHSDNMIIIPSDSTNIAMLPTMTLEKGLDNPQV